MAAKDKASITRTDILRFAIELAVVFSGVMLAFLIEQWSSAAEEREREEKYLTHLKENLVQDVELLKETAEFYEEKIEAITGLVEAVGARQSTEEIRGHLIKALLSIATFQPTFFYSDQKPASDIEIHFALLSVNQSYEVLAKSEDWLLHYVQNRHIDYLMQIMDMSDLSFLDPTEPYSIRFMNQVTLYNINAQEYQRILSTAIEDCQKAIHILNEEEIVEEIGK